MKFLTKGLLFVLFIFSMIAFTASTASDIQTCGVDKDGKIAVSLEICPDDKFIQLLITVFPESMIEVVLPFFVEFPTQFLESEFFSVYQDFENPLIIGVSAISIIAFGMAVFNFFRTAANPIVALLDPKNTLSNEYSLAATISSILFGIFLLLPYGNFLVIHHLIFVCLVFSASLANLLYSSFLYVVQDEDIGIIDITENDQQIQVIKTSDFAHNYSFAYNDVNALTKAMLCKQQTTLYEGLPKTYSINFLNSSKVQDELYIENDKRLVDTKFNDETFINYESTKIYGTNRVVSGVVFGKPTTKKSTGNVYDFDCGSISIGLAEVKEVAFEEILDKAKFFDAVEETVAQIKHYDEEAIHEAIYSGAKSLRNASLEALGIEDFKKANDSHKLYLKRISLLYHKHVLAALMIGHGFNDKGSLIKNHSKLFDMSIGQAEALARAIRERACISNREIVTSSVKAYNGFQKNTKGFGRSTVCLDVNSDGVIGVLGSDDNKHMYQDKGDLLIKKNEIENRIETLQKEFIQNLKDVRSAVEKSYVIDLFEIDNKTPYYRELRQQGFLKLPTEMFNILKSSSGDKVAKFALRNTVSSNISHIGTTFIAVDGDAEISSDFEVLSEHYNKYFANTPIHTNKMEGVDFTGFTEQLLKDTNNENLAEVSFFNNLVDLFGGLFERYNATYEMESCGGAVYCKHHVTHPIQRVQEFGDDLVNIGGAVIVAQSLLSINMSKKEKINGNLKPRNFKGKTKREKRINGNVIDTGRVMLLSIVAPFNPIAWAAIATGIIIKVTPIFMQFLAILSIMTFFIHTLFIFFFAVWIALRFIRVTTIHEQKQNFAFLFQLLSTLILFLPISVFGVLFSLQIVAIQYGFINEIIASQFGAINAATDIVGLFTSLLSLVAAAVVSLMIIFWGIKKLNDFQMKTIKTFFNNEEHEKDLANSIKANSAFAVTYAQESIENAKQVQNQKAVENKKVNDLREKYKKKEGMRRSK